MLQGQVWESYSFRMGIQFFTLIRSFVENFIALFFMTRVRVSNSVSDTMKFASGNFIVSLLLSTNGLVVKA